MHAIQPLGAKLYGNSSIWPMKGSIVFLQQDEEIGDFRRSSVAGTSLQSLATEIIPHKPGRALQVATLSTKPQTRSTRAIWRPQRFP